MSIQRQFERHQLREQGRLKTLNRHNPVAVRLINSNEVVVNERGITKLRDTFERHYLHATKGWKVDRGSRKVSDNRIPSDSRDWHRRGQPALVATRERRIPNPKHMKAEAA